jgi:hypothetical protein
MSHRLKVIKEWVDILVTAPNQKFKESFEVDKHVTKIIGLALSTNIDAMPYYRGTQRIAINEKEIYPEGYESKLLQHGFNVPVNERIVSFGEELDPGNRKVEIDFTDSDHPFMPFQPYRIRLYVYSKIDES